MANETKPLEECGLVLRVVSFKTGRLDTFPVETFADGGNKDARRGEEMSVYDGMGSSGIAFIEAGRETFGSGAEVGNAGVLELE